MNVNTGNILDPKPVPGKIDGRVSTIHGDPVVDAVVMITGDSPPHSDIAALTNDDGKYSFIDLQPGQYTLMVNAEDWATRLGKIAVESGVTSRLDFTLTAGVD